MSIRFYVENKTEIFKKKNHDFAVFWSRSAKFQDEIKQWEWIYEDKIKQKSVRIKEKLVSFTRHPSRRIDYHKIGIQDRYRGRN